MILSCKGATNIVFLSMAITRAQIARQLLAEGGVSLDDARFGLRRGGSTGFEGSPEMGGRGTTETYGFDQSGPASDSDGGFTPPPIVMADPDKFDKSPAPGPVRSFFDNVTSPIRDARQNLSINYIRNELEKDPNLRDKIELSNTMGYGNLNMVDTLNEPL